MKLNVAQVLFDALVKAVEHLEYCGYGDKWERECAEAAGLAEQMESALAAGRAAGLREVA